MNEDDQHKLTIMLGEVAAKIQVLLDKQDELGDNIAKIKEAVYNPDQGLYARLTRLDSRLELLELWKSNNTKVLWLIVSIGLGLVANTVWQQLF
tara:strand:+ start:1590 stop:1871 length:282 start_codon:yes stop_codon:yes gene_type:complete